MKACRFSLPCAALVLALSGCATEEETPPGGEGGSGGAVDPGMDSGLPGQSGNGGAGEGGGDEDAGAVEDASAEAPAVADPAPQYNSPGSHTCDGCPVSDRDSFDDAAGTVTARSYTGTVTGADGDGIFHLQSAGGGAISGSIPVNPDTGAYAVKIPLFCGQQTLKLLWTNASGMTVDVMAVVTEGCSDADIRVTLSWDAEGDDWELHLIKPGGRINDNATDCTWTSCVTSSPDWGVTGDTSDDPHKDVDDIDAYGPENIWLSGPEGGAYTVMVEHWGSGSPGSDGRVIFNVSGRVVTAQIADLAPQHVWTAGTIRWPGGAVETRTEVFDCSGNWANGCQADLP